VGSVAYGSGVGKDRVIRWDLRSQAFGVHASAASFNDLSMASAEMGHLGLGVGIVQAQLVTPVNALMGHLAENIYNMGVANATQGHTVAAPGQTQLHILPAVGTEQGHTATPIVLVKNLPAANASMGHEATPDTLAKVVLAANATQGHTATPVPIGLTVVNATMGHEGLGVALVANQNMLTVVAGNMIHDGFSTEIFSPSTLPDLKLWLAPESGVSVTASRVTQWNDKSGLNNHATQTISAAMPHPISAVSDLNGFNAVRFNAANGHRLYAGNVAAVCAIAQSSRSNYSGAIVIECSTVEFTQVWVRSGQASGAGGTTRRIGQTTNNIWFYENTDGVVTTALAVGSTQVTPFVVRWTWTSGHVSAWKNGTAFATDQRVSAGGNVILGAAPHISIGSDGDGTNAFFGHIAEVIIGATAWSSSQGRELDKLLGAKYGIAIT
jgi:hypothetical protein